MVTQYSIHVHPGVLGSKAILTAKISSGAGASYAIIFRTASKFTFNSTPDWYLK